MGQEKAMKTNCGALKILENKPWEKKKAGSCWFRSNVLRHFNAGALPLSQGAMMICLPNMSSKHLIKRLAWQEQQGMPLLVSVFAVTILHGAAILLIAVTSHIYHGAI